MNLEKYIKSLLREQIQNEENERPVKTDLQTTCFNKWKQEDENLTEEQVSAYLKDFAEKVKPKIKNGFSQPEILTFFLRYINRSSLFPALTHPDDPERTMLTPTETLYKFTNLKYTKNELVMADPGAQKALKMAERNGQATFEYGSMVAKNKKTDQPVLKMAKDANGMPIMVPKVVNGRTVTEPQTDADGNVTNVTVMAPKMIGATYKPKYITTKMRAALDTYIEKSKLLEPYLAKLNDPATYTLGEFEFMLTEFNVATIQRGEALPEPEVEDQPESKFDTKDLKPTDEKLQTSREMSDALDSKDLVFKSPDGKLRIYNVETQIESIYYGYFFQNYGYRMQRLMENGVIKKDWHYGYTQWCTTWITSGYYQLYREGNRNKDAYKFYLLVDDRYSVADLTDDEIKELPENDDRRKWSFLKNYGNMLCLTENDANGKSGNVVLCDLTDIETVTSFNDVVKIYPEFTKEVASQIMNYKPFNSKEEIFERGGGNDNDNGPQVRLSYRIDSPDYFGAKSQKEKKEIIYGPNERQRGTITAVDVWRTLSKENKEAYITTTNNNNLLDKFKVWDIILEMRGEPAIWNRFLNQLNIIENQSGNSNLLDQVKKNIIQTTYIETPYRQSTKNPNLVLLRKLRPHDKKFNFIDVNEFTFFENEGIKYDGDYLDMYKPQIFKFKDAELKTMTTDKFYIHSFRREVPKGDGGDIIHACHLEKSGSKTKVYFINDMMFKKLVDSGSIEPMNLEKGIPVGQSDPEALRRTAQKGINENKKGSK